MDTHFGANLLVDTGQSAHCWRTLHFGANLLEDTAPSQGERREIDGRFYPSLPLSRLYCTKGDFETRLPLSAERAVQVRSREGLGEYKAGERQVLGARWRWHRARLPTPAHRVAVLAEEIQCAPSAGRRPWWSGCQAPKLTRGGSSTPAQIVIG